MAQMLPPRSVFSPSLALPRIICDLFFTLLLFPPIVLPSQLELRILTDVDFDIFTLQKREWLVAFEADDKDETMVAFSDINNASKLNDACFLHNDHITFSSQCQKERKSVHRQEEQAPFQTIRRKHT